MRLHYSKLFSLMVLGLPALYACAPPHKAQVEERKVLTVRQQSEGIGGQLVRIVQSGDTLYSIAFGSNLDVNQLAAWNDISDTSRLNVGQKIRLTKPIGFIAKKRPVPQLVTKEPTPARKKPSGSFSSKTTIKSKPVLAGVKAASQQGNKTVASSSQSTSSSAPSLRPKWIWPVDGKLIRRFSPSSTQQGVDIAATKGKPVVAAAAGEVVYVGNSLKGYGNLIIVKHNENFLSAYAHNRNILVKEGQRVTDRQHIGSVGINNRRESALHFQIRRNGKPVNPLQYLPTLSG